MQANRIFNNKVCTMNEKKLISEKLIKMLIKKIRKTTYVQQQNKDERQKLYVNSS